MHPSLCLLLQAEKNLRICAQKLRLLKMSLENRLVEFPHLADERIEEADPTCPIIPRPAQLTGTFLIKLVGIEGLLDLHTLRSLGGFDITSPQHRPSTSSLLSHIMTLPRSHRANSTPSIDYDRVGGGVGGSVIGGMVDDKDAGSPGASSTLHWHRSRGGSRHTKPKGLMKQSSSQELLEDPYQGECILPFECVTNPGEAREIRLLLGLL